MLNEELSMIVDRDAIEDLERLSTDARSLLMLSTDMNSQDNVYETLDEIMTMRKRQDDTQYHTMNYQ
jgi:predicted S18 family serine protease